MSATDGTPPQGGRHTYGDIRIGTVHGSAVAIGQGNTVTNTGVADPAAYDRLAAQIGELERELRSATAPAALAPLLEQLTAAAADISAAGRPAPGRLERLRALLQDAGLGVGVASAALAVGQSVGSLLGG